MCLHATDYSPLFITSNPKNTLTTMMTGFVGGFSSTAFSVKLVCPTMRLDGFFTRTDYSERERRGRVTLFL
jgi:hypothetical protein